MSENQQNDRQEDVLPDEPVGADGAESAEPVNGQRMRQHRNRCRR